MGISLKNFTQCVHGLFIFIIDVGQSDTCLLSTLTCDYISAGKTNENIVPNESSNPPMPAFNADFATNFDAFNDDCTTQNKISEPYDRYAVFRELLQQEQLNKPTEVITETKDISSSIEEEIPITTLKTSFSKETMVDMNQGKFCIKLLRITH